MNTTLSIENVQGVIKGLAGGRCDAVVLGCTEIPLIIDDNNSRLPTLDSTRLLARAALNGLRIAKRPEYTPVKTALMHIADPRQVPAGLFIYTLRPVRLAMLTEGATPDEQALAARHWMYSQELLQQGLLVFAGRTLQRDPSTFAFAIIRAPTLEHARNIALGDPAVAGGVFSTEVFPFQPMLMGEWPSEAATT